MTYRTTKTTEDLTWQNLRENFFIGSIMVDGKEVHVDKLSEAIANGTMDALVEDCAKEYHNGSKHEVYKSMLRRLSSQLTNMNKRSFIPHKDIEMKRYNILNEYATKGRLATEHDAQAAAGKTRASYWQWSMEDINALELTDLRTICSVYDNMRSKKSKEPDVIAQYPDFMARLDRVSEIRSNALRLSKQKKIELPDTLAAKLAKGSATTLSAAEIAQLAELVKALNK